MSDVDAWLRSLGLERFIELFEANEIDAATLPKLTNDDLKDLEIPLGPRKKLLEAIAALDQTPSAGGSHPQSTSPQAGPPAGHAERRQLTVMFVDLVGSTALSARLDPEEMGAVLRAYQNTVAGEIARFEGHVAKFMGDGVLAYFGWPRAHEDEAERAVRAGLAVRDVVTRLTGGEKPLACRIGIATGLVVVGELIGEGAAQEQTVVGDTPNLAARLQALAAPGQVVVAEATRRLLGGSFVLDDLGEHALKGIAPSISAFAVTGERVLASRFEARSAGLQSMVGRDLELALLRERWAQAKLGEGQAVLLVGEAGIGKSRITRALLDALSPEKPIRIRYQCSPFHTGSALWPAIQQLEHAARLAADDPPEIQLDKLEAVLGTQRQADAPPLIAHLLGLDGTARYGRLELAPAVLRARTLRALVQQLLALASTQPVLLLVEDTHWADPTTLELIEAWLDAIASVPVLLVLTSRPDNQPSLAGHPHVTRLSLNRLGRAGIEAIVARLSGGRLPQATLDAIISRTDGVPLYVEELTKAILETGEAAIPASLHDSLMARLDHLADVKEVAQIAACIGREFDYRLLAAVAPQDESAVAAALERLIAAELVFRRGVPPEASYLFKHALVRDAAHESLLKSRRQAIHRDIFERLQSDGAAPELLAMHARDARLTAEAVDGFAAAGRSAVARPAYHEAIANFRQAVELVHDLGDAGPLRELELQIAIGQASIAGFGYGAAETAGAFRRALELLHEIGDSTLWLSVYYGNWAVRYVRAEHDEGLRLAEAMVDRAAAQADERAALVPLRARGAILFVMGRPGEALRDLERAWHLYDPQKHRRLAELVGQEPGVTVLCYKALCLAHRGAMDAAQRTMAAAVDLAREVEHPLTLAYALGHQTILWLMLRDSARLTASTEEALAYSEAKAIRVWQVWTLGWQIAQLSLAGQHEAAIAAAASARPLLDAIGTGLFVPQILGGNLRALLALGRYPACEALTQEILQRIEKSNERWNEPEIHCLVGDLRLAQGDQNAAEICYCRAIDVATTQEAKLFELRATTALARLRAERGERQQALDLLAPVYAWFTEGFATPDLVEAKALLDQLR